jgi:hypothetical protein
MINLIMILQVQCRNAGLDRLVLDT